MAYGLGVDLGTTFTAAAVRTGGRVEMVQLGSRRAEIPSLVFVRSDGGVLIGDVAERRAISEPVRLAREFKRRVGDPVPLLVGGSPYSAHALCARLLSQVLDIVVGQQQEAPSAVTVTHPANWGPYKRELLDQAVRLAELPGVTLRPEPEAAAIQYAAGEKIRTGEIVAVYDLGGGTFDAAVLRKTEPGFEVLGEPEGIEQLGGIDFDEAVFGYVTATLGTAVGELDPDDVATREALMRLRRECVDAKEALSYDTEAMIPVALPGLHTRVRLNRSEFEAMIAPTLGDTVTAMRRALASAGVKAAELRSILLAGGSSRIPLISQLLSTEFERPLVLDPHPEHSIAIGAALTAESTGEPVVTAKTVPAPPRPRSPMEETKRQEPPAAEPVAAPEPVARVAPAEPAAPVAPVASVEERLRYVGRAAVTYPSARPPAPVASAETEQHGWLRTRRQEVYADLVRESSQFATHLSSAGGRFERVWDPKSELYLSRLRYFELLSRASFLAGSRLQIEIKRASEVARKVGHRPYQDRAAKDRHQLDCIREAFAVAMAIETAVRAELD